MEYRNSLRQLSDAIDLIAMLEHLSKSIDGSKRINSEVPWAGIKITLSQSRQLLEQTYKDLYRRTDSAEPVAAPIKQSTRSSSLADRVQPLPQLAGYVRDLLPPESDEQLANSGSDNGSDHNAVNEFRFNDRFSRSAE